MTTVLITGVGAIIGYGLIKSLRKASGQEIKIIGTDIYPDAVGQAWCDEFYIAPQTASTEYKAWITGLIKENAVDLVIPGIEQDLHFLSDNRDIFELVPTKVVLNSQRLIDLSRDKWLMHQELKMINHISRIPSYLEGDFQTLKDKIGAPFLLKPRKSYASKGIVRIHSAQDFQSYGEQLGHKYMAQPIVGNDDEEYTVSIFGNGTANIDATITLRRKLAQDGSTQKAKRVELPELDETVRTLCAHFKPLGPTNLQFRKQGEIFYLLEINPRISSATSIRTAFGHNEAEMCVNFFIHGKTITQPILKNGHAVRYIEDMVFYDSSNL